MQKNHTDGEAVAPPVLISARSPLLTLNRSCNHCALQYTYNTTEIHFVQLKYTTSTVHTVQYTHRRLLRIYRDLLVEGVPVISISAWDSTEHSAALHWVWGCNELRAIY